jgi:hypothetical protein
MSSSSPRFVEGDFNDSILNSCPINNWKCHLDNSALHFPENEKILLRKTIKILLKGGYELKEKDLQFYKAYRNLYIVEGT